MAATSIDQASAISTICGSINSYFGVRRSETTTSRRPRGAFPSIVQRSVFRNIEANNQAGKIEGSIALAQTALELLAATILVEQMKWISPAAYDKLPAGDRLRLLSKWAGIPADIPTELNELVTLANDEQNRWLDGAHAFVEIRNSIVDPTKKNRERFKQHSTGT